MHVRTRRTLSLTLTLLAVGLTATAVQAVRDRLGDTATTTGWTLLTATAGLYLLSLRKQLSHARWGYVASWLQVHVYLGTFASIVFLMHVGWPVRGWFEIALASCFAIVAASGIGLGLLSRQTPRKLAALAIDHRPEAIPSLRAHIAREAHAVALGSATLGEGATLAEYYQRRLLPFFQAPRSWMYHWLPSGIERRRLLRELDDLERYLAEAGSARRAQLAVMVVSKDDLDYQYALQTRLRMCYALHMALTWALALMVGVHVVLVYRFQGAL